MYFKKINSKNPRSHLHKPFFLIGIKMTEIYDWAIKKGDHVKRESICFPLCLGLLILMVSMFWLIPGGLYAESGDPSLKGLEKRINGLLERGDIPGLTLVIVRDGKPDYIGNFGYSDLEKKIRVTNDTLFEIGSTTKAFTALAALKAEAEGKINLDDKVSKYIPWFKPHFNGSTPDITLRQLLYHVSGIPFQSIQDIPLGDDPNALQQTVQNIKDIELESFPGTQYKYATVNYDVVAYVLELQLGKKYDEYMQEYILNPLGMKNSMIGIRRDDPVLAKKIATGYKTGFFTARKYDAPAYRGNHPAGYLVTNGKDIARWLKIQMGLEKCELSPLIEKSHMGNDRVPPFMTEVGIATYGYGWMISLSGNKWIYHGGNNPNYTSFFVFSPLKKIAIGVITNSNSNMTPFIATSTFNRLLGIHDKKESEPSDGLDRSASVVSVILVLYLLIVLAYIAFTFISLAKGKRRFERFTLKKLGKIVGAIPLLAPFVFGIYLLPKAIADVSWDFAVIWTPLSFGIAAFLLLIAIGGSYISYVLSVLFPQTNKYLRSVPMLLLLSVISGLANAVIIFLLTGSLYAQNKLIYLLYYFVLAMGVYIIGRKVIQTKLVRLTFEIVYDLRMKLIEKIFSTTFQRFEKLDRGRVLATLNDDTGQISQAANIFVALLTSIITVIGCFVFLYTIAFWATAVTILVILAIAALYYFVSQKAQVYFEQARDTRNVYMRLLHGMLDGFKELSIHFNKKSQYKDDLEKSTDEFRNKSFKAMVKFINAFMIGESMLVAVLGAVGFAIPKMFPSIQQFTLMSFIMVLLYLIGPITGILNSIPPVMQVKISWGRVKGFLKDIPANLDPKDLENLCLNPRSIDSLEAKGVVFHYEQQGDDTPFAVGPVDFIAKKGEIIFIVGGNGSGKTTLAKLLTGLYIPHGGNILVDGKELSNYQLGEYFSTVFSGFHLFHKLYNIDIENKRTAADEYLKILNMDQKVKIEGDSFSTIDLSGGQKKRLALLQCHLEDCPIFLFDELAADQDPEFRKFFYRDLLVRMKESGKIVIAITHDDHYFDVADKVIKMDMGKIDIITEGKTQMGLTR